MKVAAEGDDWETDPDFEVVHTSSVMLPGIGLACVSAASPSVLFRMLCVAE